MKMWFRQLDTILRGDATRLSAISSGKITIPIAGLSVAITLLAVVAGACMGSFAIVRLGWDGVMQLFASAVKLPLLFGLTLLVTFPSLYVFNALVGSRLTWESVLRLLIAANGVMLAVFASLGPIIVFFGLSTDSYPFMKLLNIAAAGIGGILGLAFLLRTLDRLVLVQELNEQKHKEAEAAAHGVGSQDHEAAAEPSGDDTSPDQHESSTPASKQHATQEKATPVEDDTGSGTPTVTPEVREKVKRFLESRQHATRRDPSGALERMDRETAARARDVFRVWVLVYAIVGAQMGWVLRPFIGSPDMPFAWFRARESNIFLDILRSLGEIIGM